MARLTASEIAWVGFLGGGLLLIAAAASVVAYRLATAERERPAAQSAEAAAQPSLQGSKIAADTGPIVFTPRYSEQDGQRGPEDAYRDLWAGIARNDADVAIKYVPAAKLRSMKTAHEVVDSFMGLSPVEDVRVAKEMSGGDKAVLFVKAKSPPITDASGRPAPIDVVVRMVREDGYWKVESQMWLVSMDPAEQQADAMAWLKRSP